MNTDLETNFLTAIVGSEGGWSDEELDQARAANVPIVTPRRPRPTCRNRRYSHCRVIAASVWRFKVECNPKSGNKAGLRVVRLQKPPMTKEEAVEKARNDLAQRLNIDAGKITEQSVEDADFPDMSLGAAGR